MPKVEINITKRISKFVTKDGKTHDGKPEDFLGTPKRDQAGNDMGAARGTNKFSGGTKK